MKWWGHEIRSLANFWGRRGPAASQRRPQRRPRSPEVPCTQMRKVDAIRQKHLFIAELEYLYGDVIYPAYNMISFASSK